MFEIAIAGLGILVALGVLTGNMLDRRARETAWRNIATARRRNAERAREIGAEQARLQEAEDAWTTRTRRAGPLHVVDPPADLPDSA